MASFADLITQSLQHLGVLGAGEVASSADLDLGTTVGNQMLDEWGSLESMAFEQSRVTWSLTGATTYTVGTGGDVDIPRPTRIYGVSVYDTADDVERQLYQFTDEMWAQNAMKSQEAELPEGWYFDHAFTAGLGALYLWPIPTDLTLVGVMYLRTPIAQITNVNATLYFPPAYASAVVTNLALRLASAYGIEPAQSLVMQARTSLGAVKRGNSRVADLQTPFSSPRGWSVARFWTGP